MNIRTVFTFIIIIIISCQSENQISYPEFYNKYRLLENSLKADGINNTISNFDELASLVSYVPSTILFSFSRLCAEEGRCKEAAKYLEKAIINGQEYGKGIGPYKTVVPCQEEVKKVINREEIIHRQNFNFDYKRTIDSMYLLDQSGRNSEDYKKVIEIDSLNMITLLKKIDDYGYPSAERIGHASAYNAFMLILHMDRDKNNKIFKPILDVAFSKGEIWPRGYAWIVDRRLSWGDDKLEPYYYHMPSKEFGKFSVEQLDEINRRRDSIGLEPK